MPTAEVLPGGPAAPVCLSLELIAQFLTAKERQGCARETLISHDHHLQQLYRDLPEDKQVGPGTLEGWMDALTEAGYAVRSVNHRISAVNGLLEYCGRRDLQAVDLPLPGEIAQPELTRGEYLRLLSAARLLDRDQTYLLVKVFACVGLAVGELSRLTAEAVREGRVVLLDRQGGRLARIPAALAGELQGYAERRGILSGPLFLTRSGNPLTRSAVSSLIQGLARDARVEPGKCNPKCLRRLYLTTRESIQGSLAPLVEQTYDHLLDTEQLSVGWECNE